MRKASAAHTQLFFMEVYMGNIYPALFNIVLFLFRSETGFVIFPCILFFTSGVFLLVGRLIRGEF